MKKHFSLFAISGLMTAGLVFAIPQDQAPTPAPEAGQASHHQADPSRQLKMMTKRLNLTGDQQNQILPILTERQQQFESIRNDNSLAPKDRHEKMKAVREDSEAKINAILTDGQKQTYEQMKQQMRDRMQQKREGQANPNSGPGTTK